MAVLSDQQLYALSQRHFGDLGPGVVNLMVGIAKAESGGQTDAWNRQDPYGGSFGLLQVGGVHGFDNKRLMSDPDYAFAAGRQVWDQQGPTAWSTYAQVAGGAGTRTPMGNVGGYDTQTGLAVGDPGTKPFEPQVLYDGQGRAWVWDSSGLVPGSRPGTPVLRPLPQLDKGATAQAPHTAQANGNLYQFDPQTGGWTVAIQGQKDPTQPQTFTDAQGNLVAIDPYTGQVQYTYPGAGMAQETPEQQSQRRMDEYRQQQELQNYYGGLDREDQQAFTAAEGDKTRQFTAGENATNRAFQGYEGENNRAFQAGQSSLDRAERATEFAYGHELDVANANRAGEESAFNRKRALTSDQLAAAGQLSNVISMTDPAAFPAFYQAGGGVIGNAIASNATALSRNAMLPAAQTMDTVDNLKAQQASFQGYSPVSFDRNAFLASMPQATPYTPRPPFAMPQAQPQQQPQQAPPTQYRTEADVPAEGVAGAQATNAGLEGMGYVRNGRGQLVPVNLAANGMDQTVTQPTLILAGEAGPEHVDVSPLDPTAPQLGEGTASQSAFERVKALRLGVDTSMPMGVGPMNTGWSFLPPSLRARYFAAMQSHYGVPAADQQFEQSRFAMPGIQRRTMFAA